MNQSALWTLLQSLPSAGNYGTTARCENSYVIYKIRKIAFKRQSDHKLIYTKDN